MRREIPHDADIVLEEAEVHARRVEIVERPQRAVVDELPDLPHGAAEEERVIHHDLQVLPVRQLDQLLGLLRRRRERLFDEDVLAVLERGLCELEVRPDRRDDGDRIDLGRMQNLREVGGQLHSRVETMSAAESLRVLVAHGNDLTVVDAIEIS